MDKEKVYLAVRQRAEELKRELLRRSQEEYSYADNKKFFSEHNLYRIESLREIDVDDFLLRTLKIEDPEMYLVAKNGLYKNDSKFFGKISVEQAKIYFSKVADMYSTIVENKDSEKSGIKVVGNDELGVKMALLMTNREMEILRRSHSDEEISDNISSIFNLSMGSHNLDLVSLQYACELHLFQNFAFEFSLKLAEYKEDNPRYDDDFFDAVTEKAIRRYMDDHYLEKLTNELIQLYRHYESTEGNYLKTTEKKIKKYLNFREELEQALGKGEISDYRTLIRGMDEDIKVMVLNLINDQNRKEYSAVEASYKSISLSDKFQYRLLLKKYGIAENSCSLEEISGYSLIEAEKFLDKLTNLGIKDSATLLKILRDGSLDSLDRLSKYIRRGIIKLDFIRNNVKIFDSSSEIYKRTITNIDVVITENVTPSYIMENQDVLLIPSDVLARSLKVLDEYGLKTALTPTVSAEILNQQHLEEKFDMIIEQGYEDSLRSNLALAVYSKEEWKKIELLRQMNLEVDNEDLEDVLSSKNFIVGEEEIERYISRPLSREVNDKINSLKVENINNYNPLEEYAISDIAYNIGGIVVSRKKVQRNLSKLSGAELSNEDKVLLSVVNNMSITYDEFVKLKSMIGSEVIKK